MAQLLYNNNSIFYKNTYSKTLLLNLRCWCFPPFEFFKDRVCSYNQKYFSPILNNQAVSKTIDFYVYEEHSLPCFGFVKEQSEEDLSNFTS